MENEIQTQSRLFVPRQWVFTRKLCGNALIILTAGAAGCVVFYRNWPQLLWLAVIATVGVACVCLLTQGILPAGYQNTQLKVTFTAGEMKTFHAPLILGGRVCALRCRMQFNQVRKAEYSRELSCIHVLGACEGETLARDGQTVLATNRGTELFLYMEPNACQEMVRHLKKNQVEIIMC